MSTPNAHTPFTETPGTLDESFESLHQVPIGANLEVNPDYPPWGLPAAILVWLASILLLIFLQVFAVVPYVMAKGVRLDRIGDFLQEDRTAIFISILAVLPAHLLTLAVVWLVVTNFGKRPFWQSLGWSWGDQFGFWRSVVFAIVLLLFGIALIAVFKGPETAFDQMLAKSNAARLTIAFLAIATAPLIEEVVYRGVIYTALHKTIGRIWADVGVLALYTLVHVPQYWPNFGVISAIGFLSLALTLVRAYTGRLLPCFIIHLVFNGIQSLELILQPYLQKYFQQFAPHGEQKAAALIFFVKRFLQLYF